MIRREVISVTSDDGVGLKLPDLAVEGLEEDVAVHVVHDAREVDSVCIGQGGIVDVATADNADLRYQ